MNARKYGCRANQSRCLSLFECLRGAHVLQFEGDRAIVEASDGGQVKIKLVPVSSYNTAEIALTAHGRAGCSLDRYILPRNLWDRN